MFLGNNDKVYIIDKAEGNAAAVAGHPAWGSVWYALTFDHFVSTHCANQGSQYKSSHCHGHQDQHILQLWHVEQPLSALYMLTSPTQGIIFLTDLL